MNYFKKVKTGIEIRKPKIFENQTIENVNLNSQVPKEGVKLPVSNDSKKTASEKILPKDGKSLGDVVEKVKKQLEEFRGRLRQGLPRPHQRFRHPGIEAPHLHLPPALHRQGRQLGHQRSKYR